MNRLREADCPEAAFLEALGDLCPWLVLQGKSVSSDPTKPELRITPEGYWQPNIPLQPLHGPLHCRDRGQKTIQYP
jgi:hypothetical protein